MAPTDAATLYDDSTQWISLASRRTVVLNPWPKAYVREEKDGAWSGWVSWNGVCGN